MRCLIEAMLQGCGLATDAEVRLELAELSARGSPDLLVAAIVKSVDLHFEIYIIR